MVDDKIQRLGKQLVYYRGLGMRWCTLEKQFKMTTKEMKRIICLYKASQVVEKDVK
jgi:hypothetical protein